MCRELQFDGGNIFDTQQCPEPKQQQPQVQIQFPYLSPLPQNWCLDDFGAQFNLLTNNVTPPTKVTPTVQAQTPEVLTVPTLPEPRQHIARKDLSKLKENIRKRKRTTNEEQNKKTAVRPTRLETLRKIASKQDEPVVYSQMLKLVGQDRQNPKKTKPILTKHPYDIVCENDKQFIAYDHITEERKKSLETIKKEKEKLQRIDAIEDILEATKNSEQC